jgi:Flp pilus assembly protein TadG
MFSKPLSEIDSPRATHRWWRQIVSRPRPTARRRPSPGGRRGGSIIVVVALSTVALIGICAVAVDYTMLVSDANRVQRSCDAAALAGAAQLKVTSSELTNTTNARNTAAAMMAQHGVADFDPSAITFNDPLYNRITVPAGVTRNFFFAGIFRAISPNSPLSGRVTRRATAARTGLRGVPQVAPLAITVTDYLAYKSGQQFQNILIDNNRQNFFDGTMVALDLRLDNSGKSPQIFEDDVKYGTNRTTIIGQPVNSSLNADLGSQGRVLENAVNDRISRAVGSPWFDTGNNYTYPSYPANDPRIMTIMVANPNPLNNSNPQVTALFFVSVYIEDIDRLGNDRTRLRMRIMPPTDFSSDDGRIIVGDDATPITGPSVIGLTD